ncbi:MAG: N-acetylmuramoyl-L-alanine amidase family protein [Pseudolabrys sp.]
MARAPSLFAAGLIGAGLMAPTTLSARAEPEKACSRAGFRVVLDIGHTTDDTGAMSSHGVSEFAYNQVLALEIDQKLVEMGFPAPLLLLEAGPGKRSLYHRMARANARHADLFLSIHHDAVPDNFVETWDDDGTSRPFSDRFKGHSIFVSFGNRLHTQSLAFAKRLGRAMQAHGLTHTPHYAEKFMGRYRREPLDAGTGVYRYDRLHVLRTARMPAVLLEAGSILNRAEALDLQTPERRAAIVAAVTEAVDGYCNDIKRPAVMAKAHRKHRLVRRAVAQPREMPEHTTADSNR